VQKLFSVDEISCANDAVEGFLSKGGIDDECQGASNRVTHAARRNGSVSVQTARLVPKEA
jgi:hypothetical protein